MIKEPKTMAELHKLREEHYESTKNRKLNHVVEEITRQSKEIIEKCNLKVKHFFSRDDAAIISKK